MNAGSGGHRFDPLAARLLRLAEECRGRSSRPARWAYSVSSEQAAIDADVRRWSGMFGLPGDDLALERVFYAFPEFRSVFYYRLGKGNPTGALAARMLHRAWAPAAGLDITASNAGPGLFVSHGQGTVLAAESMGADCFVHQGVTVGWDYRGERLPVVGDGVFIGAGAKILGAVTVGDGARIGANAVVMGDVPAGATAVGAPARVIAPARLQ